MTAGTMAAMPVQPRRRWWPSTLYARLTLILVVGLALSHALSYQLVFYERTQAGTTVMRSYLEQDLASAVALLERLPAAERDDWLPRLERRNYRLLQNEGVDGAPAESDRVVRLMEGISRALASHPELHATMYPGSSDRLQIHLKLNDGSPLTIDLQLVGMPVTPWLPSVLVGQLALIALCSWFAVRLATRPLEALANAADTLGPDLKAERLPEDGPAEVARAATAFNAMQDRIAAYMSERMQILASISHDLQTPITRMRLRADLMDDESVGASMQRDLREMESLVREGVTYAKTLHASAEAPRRIDPNALLDSLALDYADGGQPVTLSGHLGCMLVTRPQALRRILTNLIDNALKYAGAAEVMLLPPADGKVTIVVADRGAGIPEEQLEAVFQPFVRLESSRNRESGGTGLGLAIARQLAQAMNATLNLQNREGGGLEARLVMEAESGDQQLA
jgi:signal transduction histidine kinase